MQRVIERGNVVLYDLVLARHSIELTPQLFASIECEIDGTAKKIRLGVGCRDLPVVSKHAQKQFLYQFFRSIVVGGQFGQQSVQPLSIGIQQVEQFFRGLIQFFAPS